MAGEVGTERKSIAEHLSEAFDASTGTEPEAAGDAAAAPEVPTETPEAEAVDAVPPETEGQPEAPAQPVESTKKPVTPKSNKTGKAPATPEAGPKAPQAWPAPVREHWKGLPPEVKAQVAKREQEVDLALKASASARRVTEALTKTLEPYKAFMQGDPLREIDGLFRTVVTLRTGDDETRAEIAANIIRNFRVPINRLAVKLGAPEQPEDGTGDAPQAAPNARQPEPKEFKDPRFDVFMGNLQKHAQLAKHTNQQRAEAEKRKHMDELKAFAESGKAEFFYDVLKEMNIVEKAAKEDGEVLSLDEVYERACILNKSVRPLWEQRRAASQAAANAKAASTQPRTRVATSSVRHEPTAPSSGAKGPTSLKDMLLANYEKAEAKR